MMSDMNWAETSFESLIPMPMLQQQQHEAPLKLLDSAAELANFLLPAEFAAPSPSLEDHLVPVVPEPLPSFDDPVWAEDTQQPPMLTASLSLDDKAIAVGVHQNNKRSLDARWSDELLDMPNPELRRYLKANRMSAKDEKALKEARRRKKNREYAKKARSKRLAKQSDIRANHSSVKSENERLRGEVETLKAANSTLASKMDRLQAFLIQHLGPEEANRAVVKLEL